MSTSVGFPAPPSTIRPVVCLLLAGLPPVLTILTFPRGPWVWYAAGATVLGCLACGWAIGRIGPAGRAVWAAPLVTWGILEVGRIAVVGPTVDLPAGDRLAEPVTWMAILIPRVVHALLMALPMLVGIAVGRHPRPSTALAVAPVLALGAFASLPPTTSPIPGGIAEVQTLQVHGRSERIVLRGRNAAAPMLLWLSGGPGGTELGATPVAFAALEDDFVVAVWDQPGAGLSATALPADGIGVDEVVADTIAVAEYLQQRSGHRVVLAGNSGGTFIGTLAVAARPDLFRAYVASGQMVNVTQTDRLMYRDALTWADAHDAKAAGTLRRLGPPPYPAEHVGDYATVFGVSAQGHDYGHSPTATGGGFPANLARRELGPMGAFGSVIGMMDTFAVTYPTWQGIDLRTRVRRVEVPVYLAQGAHEHPGRTAPARAWFDGLEAPHKEWVTCPLAGHRCMTEQPELWQWLLRRVLAETEG